MFRVGFIPEIIVPIPLVGNLAIVYAEGAPTPSVFLSYSFLMIVYPFLQKKKTPNTIAMSSFFDLLTAHYRRT